MKNIKTTKTVLITALLCLAMGGSAQAQTNRDDLTPMEISYTTTVRKDLKSVAVTIDIRNVNTPHLRIAMPNWSPGAYGIRRYGANIEALTTTAVLGDKSRVVEPLQIDHQTWSIPASGVRHMRVSYGVPARSRRFTGGRSAEKAPTGFHFQGPGTYMYVVGAKSRPVHVKYELPEGWDVANGLLKTKTKHTRRARDYDTFIDAPTTVGHFLTKTFEVAGTPFSCVYFAASQEYDFDVDGFTNICRDIVKNQGELFGTFPFPNYVFLFNVGGGGGGLEHLNSTSIGLNSGAMKRDIRSGASVTAHEFFHTWNVKRIRPVTLGPFEYEHENYTGNLWVSEGWTSYYGDLTMARAGVISQEEMLFKLQRAIAREMNKSARKEHSVYWASRNVWHSNRGSRVDYYAKGEILGALIDLKIRHETNNKKSLDDVMRFFNRWFAESNEGFQERDVERACTAISNYDFNEFFARHVRGTVDPPIAEYLAYAGIDYDPRSRIQAALPIPVRWSRRGEGIGTITGESSKRYAANIRGGDRIIGINGKTKALRGALGESKIGDTLTLTLRRNEKDFSAELKSIAEERISPILRFTPDPTPLQRTIRESWLSGK